MSGPVRRPLPAGATVGGRGRTSAFERIARLPDYKLVDRLLRSRACIWLIGIMLGGIVAMQVSLLKLNTGISNGFRAAETLEHQNALLQKQITELSSAELIRNQAIDFGMIDPDAGNNRFLNSRGVEKDAKRGAKRMTAPSPAALAVMDNNGKTPVEGAAENVPGATDPTQTPQTQVADTAPVTPTATPVAPTTNTPDALPTPGATPMATPTPAVTDPALATEG
ncbi:hypothetical protein OJ997_17085 [Solirubrobacter phytolaccae]|uniref:Cell division protein FtsL n=1 Tax=Solirubrobacter phytolaccae TaxID=1404360 RepID=A0A9X3NIM4_9ACTN|nr:hypothetical protein [Solirubrobacter phytolaccae]MDA0182022.1 hypothetical protein [Solirubrobacter phytolaccae]